MKEKFAIEWNNAATVPGEPDSDVDTMYGRKFWPSKSTDDAFPNDESEIEPETMSTRSLSMMLLPLCVFCRGTMTSCATSVDPSRPCPVRLD